MADWNKRFMKLAEHISTWSKDKSRKVGSVIVDEDRRVISVGFNGQAIGCDDNDESRYVKPKKLLYFVHAEVNAICACAKSGISTKNTILYCTLHPCSGCCKAIIQSGIKKVVCPKPDFENDSWSEEFKAAQEMFTESGIIIEYYEKD